MTCDNIGIGIFVGYFHSNWKDSNGYHPAEELYKSSFIYSYVNDSLLHLSKSFHYLLTNRTALKFSLGAGTGKKISNSNSHLVNSTTGSHGEEDKSGPGPECRLKLTKCQFPLGSVTSLTPLHSAAEYPDVALYRIFTNCVKADITNQCQNWCFASTMFDSQANGSLSFIGIRVVASG